LRKDARAIQALLNSLDSGFMETVALTSADARPIAALMQKYRDIEMQLADAALVHIAARDTLDTIFTLDRRDFSVYRLPRGRAFRILPKTD
jgi:uncharacterized protein